MASSTQAEEDQRFGSGRLSGPARTFTFWRRAAGVYGAYKVRQAQAAVLRKAGWTPERLKEELWSPHHEWAGAELYDMAITLRGFYLKVCDGGGRERGRGWPCWRRRERERERQSARAGQFPTRTTLASLFLRRGCCLRVDRRHTAECFRCECSVCVRGEDRCLDRRRTVVGGVSSIRRPQPRRPFFARCAVCARAVGARTHSGARCLPL